jgi:hypothetical protein
MIMVPRFGHDGFNFGFGGPSNLVDGEYLKFVKFDSSFIYSPYISTLFFFVAFQVLFLFDQIHLLIRRDWLWLDIWNSTTFSESFIV